MDVERYKRSSYVSTNMKVIAVPTASGAVRATRRERLDLYTSSGTEVCFWRKPTCSLASSGNSLYLGQLNSLRSYHGHCYPYYLFSRFRLSNYYRQTQVSPQAGKSVTPTPKTSPTSSTPQVRNQDGSHPRAQTWTNSKSTWLKIPGNQRGRSMPHICSLSTGIVDDPAAGKNPPLHGRRRKL